MTSDRELARRMLAGDERAFEELFDGHFPGLYRFALTRLDRDEAAAEEVTQAALCKAISKLSTWRGEATLFTWLCTFCRHEISDFCRRNRRFLQPRYENLFNPIELFPETEADRVLVKPERARLYGAEILLSGDGGRHFHGWVSYTWSSAADGIDGKDVARSWDQTHAVKWLLLYRPGERWSFSLSGSAHTGWPTTPVTAPGALGPRNSDRFPDYARLDAKVSRAFPLPGGRLRLDLAIVNLTDRENVCCVDEISFETREDGTVDVLRELDFWLGITPSLSVTLEL